MQTAARLYNDAETGTVKNYLAEYRLLIQRRDALIRELDRLKDATTRATARLSLAGRTGAPDPTAREETMLRMVDGQARLESLIAAIADALAERLALIEQIPDERHKTLLTLRYINGMSWEDAGYAMHYERTQIFEIHKAALAAAAAARLRLTA